MRSLDIPGGWYIRALPSGEYAALIPGVRVQTHQGDVPLPFGFDNVLFIDITTTGGFRIAGQSHSGAGNVEFNGTSWDVVAPSYGTNPVIYDNAGILHHGAPEHGAQGFRFVDVENRIWTGDETYADTALRLGEWTRHGDVAVGQSGYNLVAIYQGKRFLLAEGVGPQNIHFTCFHNMCAVSWYDVKPTVAAHARWFSDTELLALPEEGATATPPPPPPPPVGEPMRLPDRVQQIVEEMYLRNLRLAHSTNDDDRRILARMIAEQTRLELGVEWGWKSNHGIGISPAKDAIAKLRGPFTPNERQMLWIWDLFNGATREPNKFPMSQPDSESNQFFIPVEPANYLGTEQPPPPPPPPPQGNSSVTIDLSAILAPLKAEIESLRGRIEELEGNTQGQVKLPQRIALRSNKNGKLLCIDENDVAIANRDTRGSWETFNFEVVD